MRASRSFFVVATFVVVTTAWFSSACGSSCDRNPDEAPHVFAEGLTTGSEYASAPTEGPFLYFPSGRTYRLVHGLGAVPTKFSSYLAYDEFPTSFTEGAGNQVTFEGPTDTHVDVRNDTCSTVRLRVVLETPGEDTEADAGQRGDGSAPP